MMGAAVGEGRRMLVFDRVSMRFRSGTQAVDALVDVSIDLGGGRIVGLLGENGAGKTTLLRIAAGLVDADGGAVRVFGSDVAAHRRAIQRRVGWASSDERSFYPRLSGRENLRLFAALHGLDTRAAAARIDELAGALGLRAILEKPFQACSSGQRQGLSIVRALLHEPDLLLLDEPARSLDAAARAALASLLRAYVEAGERLVVVAGHEFEGLDGLLDRTLVLKAGRVVSGARASAPGDARRSSDPRARERRPRALASLLALARRDRLLFASYRWQLALKAGLLATWIFVLYDVSGLVDTSSPKVARFLAGDYFTFALIGLAFLRLTQVCLVQMASALREEQLQGTVEPLFATGEPPLRIVLGGLVWPLASELGGLLVVFGIAAALLGVHLPNANVPALALAAAATVAVDAVWGVFSAAFVLAFKRGDPVALLGNLAAVGLSGAFFPVEMIPAWLRPVADVLPLRWGFAAVRAAGLEGATLGSPVYRRALFALGVLAAVLTPLALVAFGAAIRHARRTGTLGQS
jgi:ABC-type multidrug transport system ATPase subunit/ABC-type multidrug transport system permease subunit